MLAFWLERPPVQDYLDGLEGVGPGVAKLLGETRPGGPLARDREAASALRLRSLIAAEDPRISSIPAEELTDLYVRLKRFAKQVHRRGIRTAGTDAPGASPSRVDTMPAKLAQVLYNLSGALALTRWTRG